MASILKTKTNTEFILKIISVFEGFQYKGKRYLSYLQIKPRGDEFLIRDNLIKPLFTDALNYDKQKDFLPEERIATGQPDIQIIDANNRPVIVIETLSSNASTQEFAEHRKRLFDYTDELGSKIAVLTNGISFEAYLNRGQGKAKDRLVLLKFDDICKKFSAHGIDSLDPSDWERLLKLKYLVKELQLVSPEEVYKEPELDISEDIHFNDFLEQLQEMMEQVKSDVASKFELLQLKYEEYQRLVKQRQKGKRPLYPGEVDKYKPAKTLVESFQKWQQISPVNNTPEAFQLETMYIFFNRLLLLRICEDKKIIRRRQISNGGIKDWMTFKGFTQFSELNYNELLENAYKTMGKVYPHLFREDIFDWYVPDNEVLLKVLFTFNPYNFKSVDRDVLGKLYEKYVSKEERKKLGQFYTPEEVIDYILNAVGYKINANIEDKLLLDPACGSGSFLVRATKILVAKLNKRGFDAETILNKVRENIYGFDINPFVCHLSETNLLFQVIDLVKQAHETNPDFKLEKFNIFETDSLQIPKKEGLLPLGEYTSSFYEDAETVKQIKLKKGKFRYGFDFIVGNPPYVRADSGFDYLIYRREIEKQRFFKTLYEKWDLYIPFIELSIHLLRQGTGKLGFIVSDAYQTAKYGKPSRKMLSKNLEIQQILFAPKIILFEAGVHNIIFSVVNRVPSNNFIVKRYMLQDEKFSKVSTIKPLRQLDYSEEVFRIRPSLKEISEAVLLGNICYVSVGMVLNSDEKRYKGEFTKDDLISDVKDEIHNKPYIEGKDIERYNIKRIRFLEYGTDRVPQKVRRPTFPELYENEKLMMGSISDAIYDKSNLLCNHSVMVCVPYFVLENVHNRLLDRKKERQKILEHRDCSKSFHLKYLLAILNSNFAKEFFSKIRRSKISLYPGDIEILPVKSIPLKKQQEFVNLVDQILEINKILPQYQAKVNDIPKLLEESKNPLGSLADIPEITLELKERIGKLRTKKEGLKVYLDRNSYINSPNETIAKYLELYLKSLGDTLRGKTKPEIIRLIQIPKSPPQLKTILQKRENLLKQITDMKSRRKEIDKKINGKVYKLYGLGKKRNKNY